MQHAFAFVGKGNPAREVRDDTVTRYAVKRLLKISVTPAYNVSGIGRPGKSVAYCFRYSLRPTKR